MRYTFYYTIYVQFVPCFTYLPSKVLVRQMVAPVSHFKVFVEITGNRVERLGFVQSKQIADTNAASRRRFAAILHHR